MASHKTPNGVHLNDNPKFCIQELHDYSPKSRLFSLILVLSFLICHIVINSTDPEPMFSDKVSNHEALTYVFPCLSTLVCVFLYSGFFSRYTGAKFTSLRLFLNFAAALMLIGYLVICYSGRSNSNPHQGGYQGKVSGHTALSEQFYILFIFTGVCSTFIVKAVLVASYYILISTIYIEVADPSFWWLIARNVCSGVLIIALLALVSGFIWKKTFRLTELEEWNKVYRDILDRNPSCIAVINTAGQVVYSNPGFSDMAQNDYKSFFQGVTNLRCRDLNHTFNIPAIFFNPNLLNPGHTPLPSPLTPISSEESLMKNRHSIHSSKRNTVFSRMSTKVRMNTIHTFGNLWQLLNYYRECLDQETLEKDAQLIFDGKGAGKLNLSDQSKSKDSAKEIQIESRRQSLSPPTNSYEIIIRPCTEYKKLIVILNNTTERDLLVGLENNSEYKDKVLASVSHELRTPLNGNLGYLQTALNDNKVTERVKSRFLIPALNSGKLLLHVIDDIMDYSQMQSKGIKLEIEAKPLAETLNYCYEILEHSFKSKGLKLRIKLSEDLPKMFRTDHKRLKQIILNLLTNAIKFTMQGGVTIRASCLKGSRVEIKVEDTGLGIKQQSIQKLFGENLFNQGLGFKEVNNSKGAGLGLKISQKLAELLCDDPNNESPIQVTSVYGKGSCFNFVIKELTEEEVSDNSGETIDREKPEGGPHISMGSLLGSAFSSGDVPLEHLNDDETILHEPTRKYFRIKRPYNIGSSVVTTPFERRRTICTELGGLCGFGQKVLIVDDDPLNILVLESFTVQFGLQKDSAHNGKEALEKIMENPEDYKLILMDCQMPVMDGFEATKLLIKKMEDGEIPNIPIIGCTAFTGEDKIEQCLQSGMREVLSKPVMKDQIGDIIKRYLGVDSK